MIGERRSSVFHAPPRRGVGSSRYEEACTRCQGVSKKSISTVSVHELQKSEEVANVMSTEAQSTRIPLDL
jgi:predicted RNase H-like nuclease